MKILAIDTSTEACSAALLINDTLEVQYEIAPQQHSRLILSQIDKLLRDANLLPAQLDAIAFGQGPGSFTGLRIAAGVTQGIAFAADLPVMGISTLAAQAQRICGKYPGSRYFSTIDARMKEIYWATYIEGDNKIVRLDSVESVDIASDINIQQEGNWVGVGSGWREYRSDLEDRLCHAKIQEVLTNITPSAKEVAILAAVKFKNGDIVSADKAIPIYIRNNVAKKAKPVWVK